MEKAHIRKQIIGELHAISKEKRLEIEKHMHTTLFSSEIWKEAKTIGVTISQDGIEWDTKPIIEQAWKENKKVAVPKCIHSDRSMQFYEFYSYDALEVVYYNLLEPIPKQDLLLNKQEIDLLIVPGVVYDRKGYRIGFGGGYYDRFLVDYGQTTISLVSRIQLIEQIPTNKYDIAVEQMITEEGII